jgi:glycerate-2-kinase
LKIEKSMEHIIKNFDTLATSVLRKQALLIAEAGLKAVNTTRVVQKQVSYLPKSHQLAVGKIKFDLKKFERVFCVGIGKAALQAVTAVQEILKDKITAGYIIDLRAGELPHHIISRVGTHPNPSLQNIDYTKELVALVENLTERDLVLSVISGGGSSLFTWPYDLSVEEQSNLFKALTRQGATISELNTVRKHTDRVKGGNLAKLMYPATSINLIFSDVPGDDLSMVASGPTVKDLSTIREASEILKKYGVLEFLDLSKLKLYETPKEDKYFVKTHNLLAVSGKTALRAMAARAEDLGFDVKIFSEHFSGEAKTLGAEIAKITQTGQCLLGAGESTVQIRGQGVGGRNQEMALGALPNIAEYQVLACVASDGRDNTDAAGAVVDQGTRFKANKLGMDPAVYLSSNDSYHFFESTGDLIMTGLTGANVSDFFVCIKT